MNQPTVGDLIYVNSWFMKEADVGMVITIRNPMTVTEHLHAITYVHYLSAKDSKVYVALLSDATIIE